MKTLLFLGLAVFLLAVALFFFWGPPRFATTTRRAMRQFRRQAEPAPPEARFDAAREALPAPVLNWLKKSGALDRQHFRLGRITQRARMRMKPDSRHWREATALQYTRAEAPGFIWSVKMPLVAGINVCGRDSFLLGKGSMLITLNGLIPLVRAQGPQIDQGSLQRYLGELVWFPILALSPCIRWEALDPLSARADMAYGDVSGSGTFYFNEAGDFVRFEALRFMDPAPRAPRYPWVLTVEAYRNFEGVRVPSRMLATWNLPEGPWTWLDLELTDLRYL